jgi:diacylglycerol kinase family enzyme
VRTLLGILDTARDLETVEAASAEIASNTGRLLVAYDGEVAVMQPPLRYRILPGALLVFAPVEASAGEPVNPIRESASP